jgi:hypothetical protein
VERISALVDAANTLGAQAVPTINVQSDAVMFPSDCVNSWEPSRAPYPAHLLHFVHALCHEARVILLQPMRSAARGVGGGRGGGGARGGGGTEWRTASVGVLGELMNHGEYHSVAFQFDTRLSPSRKSVSSYSGIWWPRRRAAMRGAALPRGEGAAAC